MLHMLTSCQLERTNSTVSFREHVGLELQLIVQLTCHSRKMMLNERLNLLDCFRERCQSQLGGTRFAVNPVAAETLDQ
eukprot:1697509-Rhodomonas_salina.2